MHALARSVSIVLATACAADKPSAKPVRTELSESPARPAPSDEAPGGSEPAAKTDVASNAGGESGAEELARAFIDAVNAGDTRKAEALSTTACWQGECSGFASEAQKKFKVRADGELRDASGHATLGAKVICTGDRECDYVWLLLEQSGSAWRVADVTENKQKVADWVSNAGDPLSSGTSDAATPSSTGGTVPNLVAAIARLRPAFRRCYQNVLASDPNAGGKVTVKMTIGSSGAVIKTDVVPSGNLPASVVGCIGSAVQRAQFDPPVGGPAQVTFPLVFATK